MFRAFVATMLVLSVGCQQLRDQGTLYHLEIDYEPGLDYMTVWRSFWQRGAEECMKDSSLENVEFEVLGVPDDRPVGWLNGALTDQQSCEELIDGYPYLR